MPSIHNSDRLYSQSALAPQLQVITRSGYCHEGVGLSQCVAFLLITRRVVIRYCGLYVVTNMGKNDSSVVYTVNRGDTLSKIGARFHVTVHQILQANPFIANPI
jgi:hypothetical protein